LVSESPSVQLSTTWGWNDFGKDQIAQLAAFQIQHQHISRWVSSSLLNGVSASSAGYFYRSKPG